MELLQMMSCSKFSLDRYDEANKNASIVYYDDNLVVVKLNGKKNSVMMRKLSNEECAFIGCHTGSLVVKTTEHNIVLRPHDVFVARSGTIVVSIEASEDYSGVGVGLSLSILHHLLHRGKDMQRIIMHLLQHPVTHISVAGVEIFDAYYELLKRKMKYRDRRYLSETVTLILSAFIYELFADVIEVPDTATPEAIKQRDKLFMRFIEMLNNDDLTHRRLSYFAEKLCVTPKYLSFACKQVSGKTATIWINDYMVSKLRYHLEYTDLSVKEICLLFNFPNLSFFGRYVKKNLGYSPSEYRKHFIK